MLTDEEKKAITIVNNIEKQVSSEELDRKLIVIMAKLFAEIGDSDKALSYLHQNIKKQFSRKNNKRRVYKER